MPSASTFSSISLGWTPSVDGGAPLVAYRVHYHREFGDWDRAPLTPTSPEIITIAGVAGQLVT